jgi:hypothetical protein
MKIKDLIEKLSEFNPETEVEFVGIVEYGFGEYVEMCSEECIIQEEDDYIQFIISGESLD